MKCPKCGQQIIDNKDFCINCGERLKKGSNDIKPRTAVLIILILMIFGTGVCLSIMYLGTEKELEPYLKDVEKENNNNIKKYSLKEYLNIKNISYSNIENIYNSEINKIKENNPSIEYIDFNESIDYLVEDNYLYIKYTNSDLVKTQYVIISLDNK